MTADRPTDQRATPSPFAGLPRGQTINELRVVHAQIVDLASASSKLGGFRERRRLRAARRREADLLHRLGFSSYAAFTLAFPDARESERPTRAEAPRAVAAPAPPAPEPAVAPPPRPEPARAAPPPAAPPGEAARVVPPPAAPPKETAPPAQRMMPAPVPAPAVESDRPEAITPDDEARPDEIDVREEPAPRPANAPAPAPAAPVGAGAPMPAQWHPVARNAPDLPEPIVHEVTTPRIESTSDVAMLRHDLAELLTELTSAIKGATAEIRALGELARDQRLDLEQRRVGADAEARRILEVAEAEATVLRLEAFAAARRIRGQIGSEAPPEVAAVETRSERRLPPDEPKRAPAAAVLMTPPPPPPPAPASSPPPVVPAAAPAEPAPTPAAPSAPEPPPVADASTATTPAETPPTAETAPVPAPSVVRTSEEPGRRQRKKRKRRVRTAFVIGLAAAVLLGGLVAVAYAMHDNGTSHSGRSTTNNTSPPTAVPRALVPFAGTAQKPQSTATVASTAKASKPATHPGAPAGSPPATDAGDLARENAYTAAYKTECLKIWSHAGSDGLLWDPDNLDGGSHRVTDCLEPLNSSLGSSYTTEADASAAGTSDADSAAAELTVGNRLQPSGGAGAFNIP